MKSKQVLVGAFVLLLTWSAWAADDLSQYAIPKGFLVQTGERLPDFTLKNASGHATSLSDFRGTVMVINFYTTHCGPCHRDVPALNKFSKSNPNVRVLAITCDDAKETAEFRKSSGLRWPILIDAQPYFDKIGVAAFPSFALVSSKGVLLDATYANRLSDGDGYASEAGLEKWVSRFAH